MIRLSSKTGATWIVHQLLGCAFTLLMASALGRVPNATAEALPLPEPRFPGHVGRTFKDSDSPVFPQPPRAPKNAPNIVLIMLDDVGFGAVRACSAAQFPHRTSRRSRPTACAFNSFHTAGICSPDPRRAVDRPQSSPRRIRSRQRAVDRLRRLHGLPAAQHGNGCRSAAPERLRDGNVRQEPQHSHLGSRPCRGRSITGRRVSASTTSTASMAGARANWQPVLVENTRAVPLERKPAGTITSPRTLSITPFDWRPAIKADEPGPTIFLYFATGATHSPHHAPAEWIANSREVRCGLGCISRTALSRGSRPLGVIPKDARADASASDDSAMGSLNPDRRATRPDRWKFRRFGAYTDDEVGRLLRSRRSMPDAETR